MALTGFPSHQYQRLVAAGGDRNCGRSIIVRDGRLRVFDNPVELVFANAVTEVEPALELVRQRAEDGLLAIGYVAYEAAPAFDPALATHAPTQIPLVWFALYDHDGIALDSDGCATLPEHWKPGIEFERYNRALARIRDYIESGDTYQVNYTYPLVANGVSDPLALFLGMVGSQPTDFAAYLDLKTHAIASVSPELFFRLDGDTIETRPMKGTAARGLWTADDDARGDALRVSPKDRAENVMIVDLLRNDLGRIAKTGSVQTVTLFDVEKHPTLWQMTSTVRAETFASVPEIFQALFPCGSVTGAPKIRTVEIIRELEPHPRGAYCGAIGSWGPGRQAQFAVAIRTATIDRMTSRATYPVGSGITWDSVADAEYDECRLKSHVLYRRDPNFDLLETLAWDGAYLYLNEHLKRLAQSARYFGYPVSIPEVRRNLLEASTSYTVPMRVRMTIDSNGKMHSESEPMQPISQLQLGLASHPVDASDPFLYHKTTHRTVYENARAEAPSHDDVLLWNRDGELTESTIANIIARIDGDWYTPPIRCGLLPGVMRQVMLDRGELRERVIRVDDLERLEELRLINSVRGQIAVRLADRPLFAART